MKHKSDEEFLKELLNDFKIEAAEHLQAIVAGLLKLEKMPGAEATQELVELVFREFHSMKGAARAVNLIQIEQLCMSMEAVFQEVKNKKTTLQPGMFDLFYQVTDSLQTLVDEIDTAKNSISQNTITKLANDIDSLILTESEKTGISFFKSGQAKKEEDQKQASRETAPSDPESEERTSPLSEKVLETIPSATKETVRVPVEKLSRLLSQAEELVTIKTAFDYQLEQLNALAGNTDNGLSKAVESLKQVKRDLALSIDELLLDTKKTLMYPFSSMLNIVPRIIRDLGREYQKEINHEIMGGETEIDRRILEEMKDPLIHIIRNCIDHGIETKEERLSSNKPAVGSLKVSISLDPDQKVVIRISDDGRGIDGNKLVEAAIKSGVITPDNKKGMPQNEKYNLIFKSGVSTSPFITDVSGRGLGMAIVEEKVNKIGGTVYVESEYGKGSTFTITLPQTMAAFRGLLVKASDRLFLIQTTSLLRVVELSPDAIRTVESKQTFVYNNENLTLVSLADVLDIPDRHIRKSQRYSKPVLIIQVSHKKVAFIADEVMGEHEGIVKGLGNQLKHVRNIAGAVLTGDGRLVPVLHLQELAESALHHGEAAGYAAISGEEDESPPGEPDSILVAEDSITVRNVLKNIIEASGFRVTTAVDGMEAYEKLKQEVFSLVVSDIDMPRMNGFELTAQIRNDKQLADIPVVLVTALESAEDRKRGLEAGANAYIRKGSFDKGNLIETINRLI